MFVKVLTLMIFGMAAIVGIWDLLQIEAVTNTLIQFATAGIVPGTHIVLTPGQMFIVLSGILLLAICLLFRQSLLRDIRGIRTLFTRTRQYPLVVPTIQPPLESIAAPVSPPYPKPTVKAEEKIIILATISVQPGRIVRAARLVKPQIMPALQTYGRMLQTSGRVARKWATHTAVTADRKGREYAVKARHYIEPRIHIWDAQIERALKRNAKAAKVLRIIEREYTTVVTHYTQWRAKNPRTTDSAVEK
jgi:hypothetical protein